MQRIEILSGIHQARKRHLVFSIKKIVFDMNRIINIFSRVFLLTILIAGSNSCVDLEEDTSSILSLESLNTEGDIIAALAPIYREFLKLADVPHEWQITGYGSDDITTWWAGNKAPLRVFDRFDYGNGENSDIPWLPTVWDGSWKVIYFSNNLIEGLKTSQAAPETISLGDAEARLFRAWSYFNLVKRWGNVPIILDGATPTGEEQRTTVLEAYQQIESDLLQAETVLPAPGSTAAIGRVSSAAAKAILADLYLTWTGWPVKDASKFTPAATKAKEIMDMGFFELLPIEELWLLENQNNKESVFAIQFSEVEDIRSPWAANTSFHESRGWSDLYPERQFFFDFPEGPRKEATFYSEIPQRGVVAGQIVDQGTVPWPESQRNHPMYKKFNISATLDVGNRVVTYRAQDMYRYAEILLIYAEASARAAGGTLDAPALEALNQVKRRAMGLDYLTPAPSVDVTSATAEDVVTEKKWELAGEFKRWWDLVRLEMVAEEAAMQRDPTEEVPLAIDPSAIDWKHYIAPIPFKAISTSDLIQNPEGFRIQ